ncbi:hypothetical protein PR048_003513 [Dryococelus australis]|uniref:Uncharacterized protein n=1 Tax=Dryococelus australis TaxID=614101 RepID=A0ABQ9INA5_9NEOP|nr:hypothetical protein PR048_003513 [Dryococelus australis]
MEVFQKKSTASESVESNIGNKTPVANNRQLAGIYVLKKRKAIDMIMETLLMKMLIEIGVLFLTFSCIHPTKFLIQHCTYLVVKMTSSRADVKNDEVSMEQRRNERVRETGNPREDPPTNGIVRHDFYLRKSGVTRPGMEPGSPWWEVSRLTAQPPWPPTQHLANISSQTPAVGPTTLPLWDSPDYVCDSPRLQRHCGKSQQKIAFRTQSWRKKAQGLAEVGNISTNSPDRETEVVGRSLGARRHKALLKLATFQQTHRIEKPNSRTQSWRKKAQGLAEVGNISTNTEGVSGDAGAGKFACSKTSLRYSRDDKCREIQKKKVCAIAMLDVNGLLLLVQELPEGWNKSSSAKQGEITQIEMSRSFRQIALNLKRNERMGEDRGYCLNDSRGYVYATSHGTIPDSKKYLTTPHRNFKNNYFQNSWVLLIWEPRFIGVGTKSIVSCCRSSLAATAHAAKLAYFLRIAVQSNVAAFSLRRLWLLTVRWKYETRHSLQQDNLHVTGEILSNPQRTACKHKLRTDGASLVSKILSLATKACKSRKVEDAGREHRALPSASSEPELFAKTNDKGFPTFILRCIIIFVLNHRADYMESVSPPLPDITRSAVSSLAAEVVALPNPLRWSKVIPIKSQPRQPSKSRFHFYFRRASGWSTRLAAEKKNKFPKDTQHLSDGNCRGIVNTGLILVEDVVGLNSRVGLSGQARRGIFLGRLFERTPSRWRGAERIAMETAILNFKRDRGRGGRGIGKHSRKKEPPPFFLHLPQEGKNLPWWARAQDSRNSRREGGFSKNACRFCVSYISPRWFDSESDKKPWTDCTLTLDARQNSSKWLSASEPGQTPRRQIIALAPLNIHDAEAADVRDGRAGAQQCVLPAQRFDCSTRHITKYTDCPEISIPATRNTRTLDGK